MSLTGGAALRPADGLTALPGVGPKRAEHLARLGLRTIEDLLRNAPRGYEERGEVIPAAEAASRAGGFAVVRGRVERASLRRGRNGRAVLSARVVDGSGAAAALWFNAAFLRREVRPGTFVALAGRVSADGVLLQAEIAKLAREDEDPPARLRGLRPIYGVTEGVSQRLLHELVGAALPAADELPDPLPADVRASSGLEPLPVAIRLAHRPQSAMEAERGRERLLFDALLAIEFAVRQRLRRRRSRSAPRAAGVGGGARRFVAGLPFALTPSQSAAVASACADLAGACPMGRMVVGEVGSGKTAVALAVIEEARSRGLRCALLAPTDLLARQHFETAARLLPDRNRRTVLLTGTLPRGEADEARRRLAEGEADLAIGTHALITERTSLPRLGLCVIDEQQRFGVRQRRALLAKARTPHTLVLTATPIPRTLALLAFGDVDLSLIEPRDGAVGEVETILCAPADRDAALARVAALLRDGHQAFFVRPRIGGSGEAGGPGAVELHRELSRGAMRGLPLALLHGRQAPSLREETIRAFRERRLRGLVATTVVEVGLDVPGASVLWVEEAERLGLAQLHQLRGRIARRGQKGYCWLVPSADAGAAARERLGTLVKVRDGLRLAEIDLATRGPGELLGIRQSGRFGAFAAATPPERLVELVDRARGAAEFLMERGSWSLDVLRASSPPR
jgi:ATP-dependent DNA helicase RecG